MEARDQSRSPPARSIRLTSSLLNGAYFARQFQKSSASFESVAKSSAGHWMTLAKTSAITLKMHARRIAPVCRKQSPLSIVGAALLSFSEFHNRSHEAIASLPLPPRSLFLGGNSLRR